MNTAQDGTILPLDRRTHAAQQPDWPDADALRAVTSELAAYPPLVFADECDRLRHRLAAVTRGEAFLLQGGDCAETFGAATEGQVRDKVRTLLQMSVVLAYATSVPVIKVGRMAGQYSKPRSHPVEVRGGVELPVYRGDAVNGLAFTREARTPDPERLRRMYHASTETLNLIRALTTGGYADVRQIHEWNRDFVARSPVGERYERIVQEMGDALAFLAACGANPADFGSGDFFTSHEALLLDYEVALTRVDARTGLLYDTSGHMVWIGERTRRLDGAHVEFAAQVRNPLAVKLGPSTTPRDAVALAERLNPDNEPGRLSFIARMGCERVRDVLPGLVESVTAAGAQVAWICDPMHGNTFTAASAHKTRRFDDILDEVRGFFEVHRSLATHPGGIHVELTGDDVTECLGGGDDILVDQLHQRYETACDPRLNRRQSLDLAFRAAELYRDRDAVILPRRPAVPVAA